MHQPVNRHGKTHGYRWIGAVVGGCIFGVTAVVCEYLGAPRYIRPFSLYGCIVAGVIYVHFEDYGARVWFWMTIVAVTAVHVLFLIDFAEPINRASSLLTIAIGMLDAIAFVIFVLLVADRFEKRGPRRPRRQTSAH